MSHEPRTHIEGTYRSDTLTEEWRVISDIREEEPWSNLHLSRSGDGFDNLFYVMNESTFPSRARLFTDEEKEKET